MTFRGLRVGEMTPAYAQELATWTYPAPYDIYDASPDTADWYLDPANGYSAVVDGDELVGFCCFGADGRVSGGPYDEEAVDVGAGMRPDLTGQGKGAAFLEVVVAEAERRWPDEPLRATIASFNSRAQRAVISLGFTERQSFDAADGRAFKIFVRS